MSNRAVKFLWFLMGTAVPLSALLVWKFRCNGRKAAIDRAHDITVEDSFPASDPPSAW